jgi:hypothetical protein
MASKDSREIDFPPEQIIDPDGDEREVVGTQAGGAYVLYDCDGEEKVVSWVELADPETDWMVIEPTN